MLDRNSAIAGAEPFAGSGIKIAEAPDFTLTQAAGDAKALNTAFTKLPDKIGLAITHAGRTMMRIGPQQLWVIGAAPEQRDGVFLTGLSSSRTRIAVDGSRAREILAKGVAIDFHPKIFTTGTFVLTGMHHMPVLIHCMEQDVFHIYAMRTFALSTWETLVDAAHS